MKKTLKRDGIASLEVEKKHIIYLVGKSVYELGYASYFCSKCCIRNIGDDVMLTSYAAFQRICFIG